MILVDTNIILRYLLQDNEQMFAESKEIIENHEILILGEVVAEIVYVLRNVYKVQKEEIVISLQSLFQYPNITLLPNKHYILDSLRIYNTENLDFVDSLLCAMSIEYEIKTFDKKLQKCINKD